MFLRKTSSHIHYGGLVAGSWRCNISAVPSWWWVLSKSQSGMQSPLWRCCIKTRHFVLVKLTCVSVKMIPKHKRIMNIGTTCCPLQQPLTKVKLLQQVTPVDVGNMLSYSKRWLGMWVMIIMWEHNMSRQCPHLGCLHWIVSARMHVCGSFQLTSMTGFENMQALWAIPNVTILQRVPLFLNQGLKCFQDMS